MINQEFRTFKKGRGFCTGGIGTVVVILESDVAGLKDGMRDSICSRNDCLDSCIRTWIAEEREQNSHCFLRLT